MVLLMSFYAYESKIKHVLCEFCGFLRLYSKRIRDASIYTSKKYRSRIKT